MACDVVHLSATVLLDSAVRHAVFVAVCEQPCQNLVNYKFVVQWSYSWLSAEMQLIFYKYTKTRSHTDGFRRNNANYWNKREICRFYLYSSIIWFCPVLEELGK